MNEVVASLKSGAPKPVYLLYGNEPGPIRQSVEAIRKAVLEAGMEAFNHERFSGRELEAISPVLEACAQLPFMAKRRLVELDDPEQVGKGRSVEGTKPHLDALLEYVADPNPTTVLILTSSGIDGRSKLVTATKKVGLVCKFEPIKRDRDAVAWLREQASALGMKLGSDAAAELVALVGTGQSELLTALDRASLHAGPGKPITLQNVDAVTAHTRDAVIFDLTDAVGMGQRDRALAVLARMFTENPMGEVGQANAALAMLIRQLRLVFVAKQAGGNPGAIMSAAGVPQFIARKLADQARRFDEARLRRAYAGLARLDADLKGGSFVAAKSPYLALQRWILETCEALPGVASRGRA